MMINKTSILRKQTKTEFQDQPNYFLILFKAKVSHNLTLHGYSFINPGFSDTMHKNPNSSTNGQGRYFEKLPWKKMNLFKGKEI